VDVGHGQLAAHLRDDQRVISFERLNARRLTREHVPDPVDLIVCDVSFISLTLALPAPLALAAARATLVALIKPQFEVGRALVGKGGVVRDPALHRTARERIATWFAAKPDWRVLGTVPSPIAGAGGNREFLIAVRREASG
jgi:23S rRNA (cytidine1920-2'-O)/16S rRNA (cytidine1409-2'-O)-methyltransferase